MKAFLRVVKKKIGSFWNALKSVTKTGDYWYWLENSAIPDSIEIDSLVYPYRYDIEIRKSFFELYKSNQEKYRNDPDLLVSAAREHPYYIWFNKIVVKRFMTDLIGDDDAINDAFRNRVIASAKIYENISKNGFDKRYPIVPFTADIILDTASGHRLDKKYFMGDGCHRLACLMGLGYTELPREYIKIKCFRKCAPLDNTVILKPFLNDIEDWLKVDKDRFTI